MLHSGSRTSVTAANTEMPESKSSNSEISTSSARVLGIDVLRGFAALTVVLTHYLNWWDRYVADINFIAPSNFGYYAVQLFFVISGIVIFNTLRKCHSVLHFAYLRFSRLYPTYWATLFGVALISMLVFGQNIWLGGLIVNASMLQDFLGYSRFDNVYWSLSAELAFYAHVAWLFALGWHHRVHQICGYWLAAACVWAIFIGKTDSRDLLSLLFVFDQAAFFAIGIMLFQIKRHGVAFPSISIIAFAVLTAYLVEGVTGLCVSLTVLVLASLGLFGLLHPVTNSVTIWLGGISYALYLVHRNLGFLTLEKLSAFGVGLLPSLAIVTSGAIALAWLVTTYVERPSIRFLRRLRSA